MESADPELFRTLGAVIGAVLPLLYVRPMNLRDAMARGLFSAGCGYVFYFVPMDLFHWPDTPRKVMAGAAAAGAISWFVFGPVISGWIRRMQKDE